MDRGNRKMSGIEVATLREVAENMENGTYDFTDNGKCIQCGACCSNYLPMTEKEIKIIKKYIKDNEIKECKHMMVLANPAMDFTCPFLNTNKDKEKCTIYPVRPTICRDFICCLGKRKSMNQKIAKQCRFIDVRETFYK